MLSPHNDCESAGSLEMCVRDDNEDIVGTGTVGEFMFIGGFMQQLRCGGIPCALRLRCSGQDDVAGPRRRNLRSFWRQGKRSK